MPLNFDKLAFSLKYVFGKGMEGCVWVMHIPINACSSVYTSHTAELLQLVMSHMLVLASDCNH